MAFDKFYMAVEGMLGNVFSRLGNSVGNMFGYGFDMVKSFVIVLQDLLLCWLIHVTRQPND